MFPLNQGLALCCDCLVESHHDGSMVGSNKFLAGRGRGVLVHSGTTCWLLVVFGEQGMGGRKNMDLIQGTG